MKGSLNAAGDRIYNDPTTPMYARIEASACFDSVEAAREAIRLGAPKPQALNNVAAAYEALEQWDDAAAALREALTIDPTYTRAKNNLAYVEGKKAQLHPYNCRNIQRTKDVRSATWLFTNLMI